jgi:hypothetical protein
MIADQPEDRPKRLVKGVRFVSFSPGRSTGVLHGERVGVLIARHNAVEMQPIAFQLQDVRQLVGAAIQVLLRYGDDFGHALARAALTDGNRRTSLWQQVMQNQQRRIDQPSCHHDPLALRKHRLVTANCG